MSTATLETYKGDYAITNRSDFYDKAFGRTGIKSDKFIYNYGKLGHPINSFAWYLIDDDLKIMYYDFGYVTEELVKKALIANFQELYKSYSGYIERFNDKVIQGI